MIRTNLFKLIGEGLEKIADAVENKAPAQGSHIKKTSYSSRPSAEPSVSWIDSHEEKTEASEDVLNNKSKNRFHSDFVAFVSFFQDLLIDEDLASESFSVCPTDANEIELKTRSRNADLILNYHQSVCSGKFRLKIRPIVSLDPRFSDELTLDLPDLLNSFHLSHKFGYRRIRSLILWIQTMLEEIQILPKIDETQIKQNRQLLMHSLKELLSERDFGIIGPTYGRHYIELKHSRYSIEISEYTDTLEHASLRIVGMRHVSHSKRPQSRTSSRYSSRPDNLLRCFHIPILQMVPTHLNLKTPDYNRAEALLNLVHQLAEDILIREAELMQKVTPISR
ncbi:MAG: hypothetical protein H3C47_02845 [Candidatus Cloacimonetes bacterium]|nr:hypothetical protein [Candidatus Cloacimonadota bacterium]